MIRMAVNHAIDENKTQNHSQIILNSNGVQKELSNAVNTLLGRQKQLVFLIIMTKSLFRLHLICFLLDKIELL